MRRSISCSVTFTLILLIAVPWPGAAQADPRQIPMELALALVGGQGRDTRIFVGPVPSEVEESIPLGPVERVVGGLVRESSGTVIVQVAGSPEEALPAYFEHLEGLGWTRPRMPLGRSGGFQPTVRMLRQVTWCGERYSLSGTSMSFDSTTYLRLNYVRREPGRGVCDLPETRMVPRRDPFGSLDFPELEPPPGAVVRPGGGGASSNGIEMETTIETELGIEALFEHYARQLAAAGWVRQGRAADDGVAIGRWIATDAEGASVVGTMGICALMDGNAYRAWLRLDRGVER